MKKILVYGLLCSFAAAVLTGCFEKKQKVAEATPAVESNVEVKTVSFDEGVQLAATTPGAIIVDVRRPDEFAEGHLPTSINFPRETITEETAASTLPDKSQTILVHCKSGGRSKMAAKMLTEFGYSNIIDMGGIMDYTGEIVK